MGYDKYCYIVDQVDAIYETKGEDWEKQVKFLLDILNRQQQQRAFNTSKQGDDLEDNAIYNSFEQLRQ